MGMESDYNARNPRLTERTENQLREDTSKDTTLNNLYKVIVNGWPTDRAGITQVLVPQSMQKDMLRNIHANHVGGESNIRMAREVLFWSGMRKSIQGMCDACSTCAQYGHSAPKGPVKSLPIPTGPWQIVSQDLCELEK